MIEAGAPAPDFESLDSRGEKFRLSSLRGKKVVLYFFPKAFTTGCTIETKGFGEISPALAERGVHVVGVSVDEPATEAKFAAKCGVTFPIVGDPDKSIAKAYGVLSFIGITKRVTFFIDESGVIRDVVSGLMPGPHVDRAKTSFLAPG